MATIQSRKSSDGTTHFRVLIRLKGRPIESATFQRKTDAQRWAQQTEAAIREGRYFKTTEARRRTLGEMVERYIAEVVPARASRDQRLVASQLRWWSKHLGRFTLDDISPTMIAEQRNKLGTAEAPGGRPATPATRNRYLQAISHAFTIACREWEWINENPVRKVRRLREPRGRVRFLSNAERERLLQACTSTRVPCLRLLVLLAMSTGARRTELLSLQWSDLDLDRGIGILHETKNGERRAIPIAGPALEGLREWHQQRKPNATFVFANGYGRAAFPRKAWDLALANAQLENFRFHDLRHTAASYLAMSGATLAEIAEILGHKTLAMVKRYSHLTEAHTVRVVAKMNQQFLVERHPSAEMAGNRP